MPLTLREQRVLTEGLRTLKRRATVRIESEQACVRLIDDLLTLIAPQPINRAKVGSKSWQVGQLLLRPQGCTAQEAMSALGWPSISMKQQAHKCGLELIRDHMGHRIRFRARPLQRVDLSMAS
jgi:hypothetical protein